MKEYRFYWSFYYGYEKMFEKFIKIYGEFDLLVDGVI